jgi:hypothetical protein
MVKPLPLHLLQHQHKRIKMAAKPYLKKKSKKKRLIKTALAICGVFTLIIVSLAVCFIFDIGPINELSCYYFKVDNPTYKDMVRFIITDETEQNEYTPEYRCGHFSRDVIMNARREGMQAGFVRIESEDSFHAIVAFKTKDRGLFFLEPQSDVYFHETRMQHYMETGLYYVKGKTGTLFIPIYSYRIYWMYGI